MENEEIVNQEEDRNKEESALLKAYKELKANTIPKEKYEKDMKELKEKNDIYLKAITEGASIEAPQENVSLGERIDKLSKFKGTNLEYWDQMTSTIDSMLKSMPEEEITKVTGVEGLEEIVKVNEGMKQMVKDSNGDPDYFRTLYNNRVQDSAPRISTEIAKAGGLANYLAEK